jgi:hypothetical protein
MTKKQAERIFKEEILPQVIKRYESDGRKDIPARRFEWSTFIDSLCKDGQISQHQYDTWGNIF